MRLGVQRLEWEKEKLLGHGETETTEVYSKKRSRVRDHGEEYFRYNVAEAYGYRPAVDSLLYLSPWEFLMWWDIEELRNPLRQRNGWTRWVEGSMSNLQAIDLVAADPQFKFQPGVHFVVNEDSLTQGEDNADGDLVVAYPDEPELHRFWHQWVLRRRARPVVPSPECTPMPHRGIICKATRAKYFSVYMRPWVLLRTQATTYVPHIGDLDVPILQPTTRPCSLAVDAVKRRVTGKRTPAGQQRSYAAAWRSYIKGNIVSNHAARLIRSFVTTMMGTGKVEADSDDEGVLRKRGPLGTPGSKLSAEQVQNAISVEQQAEARGEVEETQFASRMRGAMRVVAKLLADKSTENAGGLALRAHSYCRPLPGAQTKKTPDGSRVVAERIAQQKVASAQIYKTNWVQGYKAWRKKVIAAEETPNIEQWALLDSIHDRCEQEQAEEATNTVNHSATRRTIMEWAPEMQRSIP